MTLYEGGNSCYELIFLLAVGCERFADDLSLVVLNKENCEKSSECSGEKQIDLFKTRCSLLPESTQYIHNETWTVLKRIRNGSFAITVDANEKVFLKVAIASIRMYSFGATIKK